MPSRMGHNFERTDGPELKAGDVLKTQEDIRRNPLSFETNPKQNKEARSTSMTMKLSKLELESQKLELEIKKLNDKISHNEQRKKTK